MAEYIRKEKLIQRLKVSPLFLNIKPSGSFICDGVIDIINKQSVADVVEVVRCKDCKYCYSPMNDDAHYCNLKHGLVGIVAEEDYCSYGERSES